MQKRARDYKIEKNNPQKCGKLENMTTSQLKVQFLITYKNFHWCHTSKGATSVNINFSQY